MSIANLGRTLVIANPASHSGKGALAIEQVRRFFESYTNATQSFEIKVTTKPLDAVEMAAQADAMDTVIALGGDGIIHEVANGLMGIDEASRPRLGIIPMGSGNDFARTLNATFNNPDAALAELLHGKTQTVSLGCVKSDAVPIGPADTSQGTYFMETLSFGLDAAIALDTTVRRAKGDKQEGSALFLTSSIKLVTAGTAGYPCTVRINNSEPLHLQTIIFTVQNGPTYGGGFRICPDANPTDDYLDLCYNVKKPSLPHLLFLLGLARFGKHTHARAVAIERATSVVIDFESPDVPCQIDGEELKGQHFEIALTPRALEVIVPQRFVF